MDDPWANGHRNHDGIAPGSKARSNGFTIHEALPYSPHSSVIPFIPDYLPEPNIGSGPIARKLAGTYDASKFDALNRDAAQTPGEQPKSVRHAADAVLHDFKSSMKTTYKFKEAPLALPVTKPSDAIAAGLSPMSKAVFDAVGSFFTKKGTMSASPVPANGPIPSSAKKAPASGRGGATPVNADRARTNSISSRSTAGVLSDVSPAQAQAKGWRSPKKETPLKMPASAMAAFVPMPLPPKPQPPVAQPSQSLAMPQPASTFVVQIQTQHPPPPTASQAPVVPPALPHLIPPSTSPAPPQRSSSCSSQQFAVLVEIPTANFNRDEYIAVDDSIVDLPSNLSSRKRKRDDVANRQGMLSSNLDHRQRMAAAMQDLAVLTSEMYRALDNPSGDPNSLVVLTMDSEPALSTATHQKLQSLISKTIDFKSYQDVRLKDLLQFLKLSENTLKHTSDLALRFSESWNEEDVAVWVGQLGDVEHSLKAARTALRIMSGGRDDKQLYSENMIQACVKIVKDVLDSIVVPIVELRTSSPLFRLLTPHKKAITSLMTVCQRVYTLLASLTSSIQLSDMVLTGLSYDACKLTFVDNALTEKESVVGMSKFDGIRLVAMDVICRIFLIRPDERRGILNDILTSLEKLPIGRQSAKQFKISDGGSIQPVSALIMRLMQASAGKVHPRIGLGKTAGLDDDEEDADKDQSDEEAPQHKKRKAAKPVTCIKSEDEAAVKHQTSLADLRKCADEPMATVLANINYVIHFVTDRALKATKSGESPYRNLLDQFVEDFTLCLSSPDWPAAELILRQLMTLMTRTFENEKSAAPAKNTALEILGNLCAAISNNRSHVRKTAISLGTAQSDELGLFLAELSHSMLDSTARLEQVFDWSGPYRATLEYLQGRVSDDPHLASAISFLVTDWAEQTLAATDAPQAPDEPRDQEYGRMAYRLRMMIEDQSWLANEYSFKAVTATQAKVAYLVILLQSRLFTSFAGILNVLLRSMASDQATVRSRSLKSINQVIETDPSILDGDSLVVKLILQCSNDSSTQVRDSALGLIGKCIAYRQQLEQKMLSTVLERFLDQGVGVRKRAMKLARDIYLRNKDRTVRSDIANGLLLRVQDPDEGVQELAKQMIEEVWFTPFYTMEKDAAYKIAIREHVALIIHTVKSGNVTAILDKIFESILDPDPKPTPAANGPATTAVAHTHNPSFVCAQFVEAMFDFISNMDGEDTTMPSGKDALNVLHIFAKADPALFTYEQISVLKPYLALSQKPPNEELVVFRSVALVYRRVLPNFSAAMYKDFLVEVRTKFLAAVGKVAKQLLDEVIACIWIISDHLKSLFSLVRMSCSSIGNLKKFQKAPLERLDRAVLERLKMYMLIVGFVGKHARLEDELATFKKADEVTPFPPKCETVSRLMLHHLLPFTDSSKPHDIRQAALEAMGLICQSNPRNYVLPFVYTALQSAFDDQDPGLEDVVVRSFKEFFLAEELRSSTKTGAKAKGDKRHLLVMGGTNYDDVASATTQRFLESITRIALATQDEHAFLAIELIGSINRQGLVHPKETGVTLITLETSQHRGIWELAYAEHRGLHEKHESTIEREYAKAMQSAYNYQRDVVKDTHGATTNPFQAKFHLWLDVLKISKSKNRQRFFDKLCSQLDFDPATLDVKGEGLPPHVEYCRFIIENITYIEYITVGEVMVTVAAMEKLVTTLGTGVAHMLESELLNMNLEALNSTAPAPEGDQMQVDGATSGAMAVKEGSVPPQSVLQAANIDRVRLRRLTASAMVLHAAWESRTYLRRLYSLGLNKRDQKAKAQAKDLAKTPVKVQGIHGDKIWEELATIMNSLQSEQSMIARCKSFVELMKVDKDFKVADDGDEEMEDEAAGTPSDDEDRPMAVATNGTPEPSGRGRKRRAPTGTPKSRKKQARSSSQPSRRRGRPSKTATPAPKDSDIEDLD